MSWKNSHPSRDVELVHRFVADEFDIEVGHVDEVVHGVNRTFLVQAASTGRRYFLRLYRERDRAPADIAAELNTLNAVRASDSLKVSRPVSNREHQYLREIATADGTRRSAVLFEEAQGQVPKPTQDDMRTVGQTLAELHRQAWLSQFAPSRTITDSNWIQRALDEVSAHSVMAAGVVARLAEGCRDLLDRSVDKDQAYWGFCHGDFRLDNLRRHGQCITMFDFDDCGMGPQLFDLATLAWWLELGQDPAPASLWTALVEGYCGVLPERNVEKREIARLVICNALRSLQFLIRYCHLPDDLWCEQFERLEQLGMRASNHALRIYCEDTPSEPLRDTDS
ncbi:Stress response kinase A [Burkholderia pseudomultivorans]|uniref:Stress response kinase A n=1 Tax=Burkholderia pseudomultivorans TaxID=1207504 RepID=A0A6P2QXF6_9BURK|nr:phosphotransferase [Burkholderia pseudomultivorans]VWC25136.1 Stress response kinase A [Burkholderia pseudomultivorans]